MIFADVKTFLYLCTGFQKHPSKSIQAIMNVRDNKIETLLECIGDETKTRRQIQADMNLRNRRNFRLHYLNPAMDKGWVRFLYVEPALPLTTIMAASAALAASYASPSKSKYPGASMRLILTPSHSTGTTDVDIEN